MKEGIRHLVWIIAGAAAGFGAAFVLADRMALPKDLYYLCYLAVVAGLFVFYRKSTGWQPGEWLARHLGRGLLLGLIFAALMVQNVWSRPATEAFTGAKLIGALFWRGLVYGAVDGLLLTVFPWVVVQRAFRVREKPPGQKVLFGFLAWICILFVTTAYHLGYPDFRSRKVLQANLGNTIMSVPTLVSGSPVASVITHAALHVAAVLHAPQTELFLPPHRG